MRLVTLLLAIFLYLGLLNAEYSDASHIIDLTMNIHLPKASGNLLIIEQIKYYFDTPHTEVYRSLPAGYSPNRLSNNDGIGNFLIFYNNQLEIKEEPPSLYNHEENTFEIFEDVNRIKKKRVKIIY